MRAKDIPCWPSELPPDSHSPVWSALLGLAAWATVGVVDLLMPANHCQHPQTLTHSFSSTSCYYDWMPGSEQACPYHTVDGESQGVSSEQYVTYSEKKRDTQRGKVWRRSFIGQSSSARERRRKKKKRKGWAGSGPGGAAAPRGLNSLVLSQGRIHSTESPNPTPSPLRETVGNRKRQQERHSMTKRVTKGR